MKIVFICGSFERGADGVGDYTRRLAQSMLNSGHNISIVAMRDAFIDQQKREIIETENGGIEILRLPATIGLKEAGILVKEELNEIKPDWVSVQFVIFAFHPKGLPFGLGKVFKSMLEGYKVQMMFHELWLGIDKITNLKHSIWGFLQKQIVVSILNNVKPLILHTNSNWYAAQMSKLFKKVKVLPLFSNIPVVSEFYQKNRSFDWSNSKTIQFVLFGHISLHAPVNEFVQELFQISKQFNKEFSITFIGKNNEDLKRWTAAWKARFKVDVLGIQSEHAISKCLSTADIGIATTPYALLGKSGSFYAMLDHGLPVISVSDLKELGSERVNFTAPKGLSEYKIGNLLDIFNTIHRPIQESKLETTKNIFIEDLLNAHN